MNADPDNNKILLVDDEEDIREVLHMALSDMGYFVLPAENGKKAWEIFLSEKPSIVITDIKMPVLGGIELLKRIKRENREVEVIMITGHGDMDLAIKSLKHHATDFIKKPINIEAFEISLKRAEEKIITRKKLQEYTENLERLIQEKTELKNNLQHLGLMVGSISHSIKGLLTGLDGGLYLLKSGLNNKDFNKIEESADILKVMLDRIRRMVGDILFYAKERRLRCEDVDVLAFADEVMRVVEPKSDELGVQLEKDFVCTIHTIQIDAGFIHSALINILENAFDACARNTKNRKSRIVFSVKNDDSHVVFIIKDNGVGMDTETKEKLFSLFFSSKGHAGTGLGLFLSNKLVVQHGGAISVDSIKGEGSQFTIKIPIRRTWR